MATNSMAGMCPVCMEYLSGDYPCAGPVCIMQRQRAANREAARALAKQAFDQVRAVSTDSSPSYGEMLGAVEAKLTTDIMRLLDG